MKKTFIALVLVFAIPLISFASIDKNLSYGSQGIEVSELQDFLIVKGFLPTQSTGNFFSLTSKAVIDYQTSEGIPATGFVGSMTRAKINNELSQLNAPAISAEISETGMATTTSTETLFTNGCLVGYKFSPVTGHPCPQLPSMPAGCQIGYAFSSTTGQSCSITSTSTSTPVSMSTSTSTATTTPLVIEKHEENHATTTSSGTVPAVPATSSNGGDNGNAHTPATPAVPAVPAQAHDTTAPVISNISATTTQTTVTIIWETNELADSRVAISTSTPLTAEDLTMTTSHNLSFSNLINGTTYYYVVVSKDASVNIATSSVQSFVTLTPVQIQSPTSIEVMYPNGGETIGMLNMNFTYTSNNVSRIGFKLLKGSQVVYENTTPITSGTLIPFSPFPGNPAGYQTGNDYKLRVYDWSTPGTYDDSNNYFNVDVTPPVVSSVLSSSITSSSAVITWVTDEPATGFVNYGSTQNNWAVTPSNTSYLISHSITLSNLASGTLYTYRVYSNDAMGNGPGLPPEYTFTTL